MFSLNRIHFLLFFVLLSLTTCVDEIQISGATEKEVADVSFNTVFKLRCSNFNKNYLKVDVDPFMGDATNYELFVGKQENLNKLSDDVLMRGGINEQYMYIPRSLFTTTTEATIYLLVHAVDSYETTSYKIRFAYENEIEIKIGQDYSLISAEDNRDHYYKFNKPIDEGNQIVNFYAIGGHDGDIDDNEGMSVVVVDSNGVESTVVNHRLENVFYGGDLIVVDENVSPLQTGYYYKVKVRTKAGVLIRVGVEYGHTLPDEQIHYNITYNGYLNNKDTAIDQIFTKCYRVDYKDDNAETVVVLIQSRSGIKAFFSQYDSGDILQGTHTLQVEGADVMTTTSSSFQQTPFLCFGTITGLSYGDFQVKIFNGDTFKVARPIIDPLYNGVGYPMRLKQNDVQMYTYSKYTNGLTSEVNYNVRTELGKIDVYVIDTTSYPYYSFTPNQGEGDKSKRISDINGFFQYHGTHENEGTAWSRNKTLLAVVCKTSTCKFEVSFFDDNDYLNIKANFRYLQTMLPNEEDHFMFQIKNSNISSVIIELTTLTGDSNMEIFKETPVPDDVQSYYIGNKEIVNITKTKDADDLVGRYQIIISSAANTVYLVSYYTYLDNSNVAVDLDGGFQYLEYIDAHKKKTVRMQNQYIDNNYTYVTTFHPINCDLNIMFSNEGILFPSKGRFAQHIINSTNPEYKKYEYKYDLTVSQMDNKDFPYDNELCLVYIASASVEPESELVVAEATPTTIELDYELSHFQFLFPRPPDTGEVIVQVNVEADVRMTLEYSTERLTEPTVYFSKGRQIVIPQDRVDKLCNPGNVCPIAFKLSLEHVPERTMEAIQIVFTVKTQVNKVPQYLTKFKLVDDFVYSNSIQYFTTDIGHKEAGEIMVNFNRGSGYVIAKLLKKEYTEEDPDWNNKVRLPTPDSTDLIKTYNKLTGKLLIKPEDTEQCIKGCDIYIAVVPEEQYADPHIDEFTIYYKSYFQDPRSVDIPVNEFVHGAVEDISIIDYYQFNLPINAAKVTVEFNSDMCEIGINSGYDKPTDNMYKYVPAGSILEDFNVTEYRLGDVYSIGVKCRGISHVVYSPYNFRIRTVPLDDIEIINVDSSHEVLCQTKGVGAFCDFIISNDPFDNITEIALHAWSHDGADLVIYAYEIPQTEFDQGNKAIREGKLAREGLPYVKSSKNQDETDYLYLGPLSNSNTYVLVSVQTSIPSTITFVHSYRSELTGIHVPDFTARLVTLKPQQTMNFILPKQYETAITVSSVHGQGAFSQGTEYTLNLPGNRTRMHYNQPIYKPLDAKITNVGIDNYVFYVWYQISASFQNVNEVRHGMLGHVLINSANIPIVNFARYSKQEAVSVSYKVNGFKYDSSDSGSFDDFDIKGYIVDLEFISQLRKNSALRPQLAVVNNIFGFFDHATRVGYLEFDADDLILEEGKQKYMMMVIEQAENNHHRYNDFVYDIAILPNSGNEIPAQPDMYYFHEVKQSKGGNVHFLQKKTHNAKTLRLEFSANNKNIICAFSSTPFEDKQKTYTSNLTPLTAEETAGKTVYTFNVANLKGVYIGVYDSKTDDDMYSPLRATKYTYKFTLDAPEVKYTINNHLEVKSKATTERHDQATVLFEPIKDASGNNVVEATYFIKFYRSDLLEEFELVDRIAPAQKKPERIAKLTADDIAKKEFTMTDLDLGSYYITMTAEITATKELFTFAKDDMKLQDVIEEVNFNSFTVHKRSDYTDHVHGLIKLDSNMNKNAMLIKLRDFEYTKEVVGNIDRFIVHAYYVNSTFVNLLKQQSVTTDYTKGYKEFTADLYNMENIYYMEMDRTGLSDYDHIYYIITRHPQNRNYYSNYVLEIAAYEPNAAPKFDFTAGQFYVNRLTPAFKENYYKISRTGNNNYYALEFASRYMNSTFQFTVEKYDAAVGPKKMNETTNIIQKVSQVNGKTFVIVQTDAAEILVSFFVNNIADQSQIEYFFKYTSSSSVPVSDFDKYKLSISHLQVSTLASFELDNLLLHHEEINKIYYKFNIYAKADIQGDNYNLVSSLFNPADNAYIPITPAGHNIFYGDKADGDKFIKSFNLDGKGSEFIVFVQAHAELNNKEELKIGFNPTTFITDSIDFAPFDQFFTIKSSDETLYKIVDPPEYHSHYSILTKARNVNDFYNIRCYFAFIPFETAKAIVSGQTPAELNKHEMIYHQYEKAGYYVGHLPEDEKDHYVYIDCNDSKHISFELDVVVYAFDSKVNAFRIPQNQYFVDGLINEYNKVHVLDPKNGESIYEINYSEETNKKYFSVTVEPYIEGQDIRCQTYGVKVHTDEKKYGNHKLVVEMDGQYKDKPLLMCFQQNAPLGGSEAAFEFSYRTVASLNDVSSYDYSPVISVSRNEFEITVEVENINYNKQDNTNYVFRIYDDLAGVDRDEIDTVYFPTSLENLQSEATPLFTDEEIVNKGSQKATFKHTVGHESIFFLTMVATFTDEKTGKEQKLGYEIALVSTFVVLMEKMDYDSVKKIPLTEYKSKMLDVYAQLPDTKLKTNVHVKINDIVYSDMKLDDLYMMTVYYVDDAFISKRKNDPLAKPDGDTYAGAYYPREKNLVAFVPAPKDTSKKYIFLEIEPRFLELKGYYTNITFSVELYRYEKARTLPENEYLVSTLNGNYGKVHETFRIPKHQSVYVEYGERLNDDELECVAESDKNTPTYKQDLKYNVTELAGKKAFVYEPSGTSLISCKYRTGESSAPIEYFIKIKTANSPKSSLEPYMKYEVTPIVYLDLKDASITATFNNLLKLQDNIQEITYKIKAYNGYAYSQPTPTENLFVFRDQDPHDIHPDHEITLTKTRNNGEDVNANITATLKIDLNVEYFIAITAEFVPTQAGQEEHRFGFDAIVIDARPKEIYRLTLGEISEHCVYHHFNEIAMSLELGANDELPNFNIRYTKVTYLNDVRNEDVFNINGYNLDGADLATQNNTYNPPESLIKYDSRLIPSANTLYLTPKDTKQTNNTVYIKIERNSSNTYEQICWEVLPFNKGTVPKNPIPEGQYFYGEIDDNSIVTYKLAIPDNQRVCGVELIQGYSTNTDLKVTGENVKDNQDPTKIADYTFTLEEAYGKRIGHFKVQDGISNIWIHISNKADKSRSLRSSSAVENFIFEYKTYATESEFNPPNTKEFSVNATLTNKDVLNITFTNALKKFQDNDFIQGTYTIRVFDPSVSGFSEKAASSLLVDKVHNTFSPAAIKKGVLNANEDTINTSVIDVKPSEIFVVVAFDLSDSKEHVTKLEIQGVTIKKEGASLIGLWITLAVIAVLLIAVFVVLKLRKKQLYGNVNLPTDEMKLVDDDKDSTIN